jgi:hypothetical protein
MAQSNTKGKRPFSRLVQGVISHVAGVPTVVAGTGFTAARVNTGTVRVTLTDAGANNLAPVCGHQYTGALTSGTYGVVVNGISGSTFTYSTTSGTAVADAGTDLRVIFSAAYDVLSRT